MALGRDLPGGKEGIEASPRPKVQDRFPGLECQEAEGCATAKAEIRFRRKFRQLAGRITDAQCHR
jgi:hypothetical protein